MRIRIGTCDVPAIYSAHHASHGFERFTERVALTPEQGIRFSDYGTADSVPVNGLFTLVAEQSRALGDLNRAPDDPGRFQDQDYGKPERHDIWLPGRELTEAEKRFCQRTFYNPYHDVITKYLSVRDRPTFVIAWDNTADYEIGADEAGNKVSMPDFILSNRGVEGSFDPLEDEEASCDPEIMETLASKFEDNLAFFKLPNSVERNLVYKGGYITRRYSSRRNPELLQSLGITCDVQSFQLEYNTALTHMQHNLNFNPERARDLRNAFSFAMIDTVKALDL